LSNNPTEALEIFERLHAATQTPSYELLQNKGNAHADLGQLEQASECYKQVIKLQPNYVPAHENLTSILWTLGQQSNFVDSFQETIESGLSDVPIQQAYVEALLTAEKPDRALAFLATKSSLLDPEDQRVADFVARCHLARNDTETAIRFHKRACTTRETAVPYWIDYAVTLIVAGEIEQASDILEQLSERAPADQMVLAHLSLCWRMLDDPRARILNNFDLVGEYELPTPPGFSSLAEFNMALNECLTEYHTSEHHPLEQTLRQGTQTQGNLFARENRLLQLLKNSFRGVITRHIKKMQDMPAPYPGFSTERDFDFAASWSVRLRDQGFHTQHIHPMGWFSSAYYVDLPSELESSADDATPNDQGGWIKFGEPNLKCTPPLQAQHIVKPKVGKLILFPSYMWHGTIPFKSAETRTTVVFDVAPSDH
jgi:tetratricopeptide (TPR) repeat protein